MKTYIVQLEDHDDIISTRDKISWSKARRILLVWPGKGRVLERRVDLLILQRHSQQLGAQLAFVTKSREVKVHARELGIPIFPNAVVAQQFAWRVRSYRKASWRRAVSLQNRPANPGLLREQWLATRRHPMDDSILRLVGQRFPQAAGRLRLGVFALGVLALLALALAFMPGADVFLKPARKSQQLTIAAWASPQLQAPNVSGGFPAQTAEVEVEGRDQVDGSGVAWIPDQYATGQVTFTNLTDQAVDVPEGSVVLSAGGNEEIRFLTTEAVHIPAIPGKVVKAGIRAELPGTKGNLRAGQIQAMQGPVGLRLAVTNPESIRGGTDRSGRMPTEQDYTLLRQKLRNTLQKNAQEEARLQAKPGQRLLDGAIREIAVVSETREPAQGQPADRLQLTLRVKYEVWYVKESDLNAIAGAALEANREPNFQPVPGSLNISFASHPEIENGVARWDLKIEQALEASWSREGAVRLIQGRGLAEAKKRLQSNLTLAEAPRIRLYPGWWRWLPFLPARIHLVSQ